MESAMSAEGPMMEAEEGEVAEGLLEGLLMMAGTNGGAVQWSIVVDVDEHTRR